MGNKRKTRKDRQPLKVKAADVAFTNSNVVVTMRLVQYVAAYGRSPFSEWFLALDPTARAKVTVHLTRMECGNLSNVEPVGSGVCEKKINWGPGYRIYFGRDGDELVVLLAGSDKSSQAESIKRSIGYWDDYKQRKSSRQWH
jgi:putative addiction module killer protein